jgi:hypothetical protein
MDDATAAENERTPLVYSGGEVSAELADGGAALGADGHRIGVYLADAR